MKDVPFEIISDIENNCSEFWARQDTEPNVDMLADKTTLCEVMLVKLTDLESKTG